MREGGREAEETEEADEDSGAQHSPSPLRRREDGGRPLAASVARYLNSSALTYKANLVWVHEDVTKYDIEC